MALGQPPIHKTFKEIKIHTAKCDQCNKHNSATIYRCEDCSEQCCTPCWNLQAEDGKHLLNHALTVIIPASTVEKRKTKGKKPAKVVKQAAKKTSIANQKVVKKPVAHKRDAADDDNDDDHQNDVEIGDDLASVVATTTKGTTRANKKQGKNRFHAPSDVDGSSNPDAEVVPVTHSTDTTQKCKEPVGSKMLVTPTFKATTQGRINQASGNDIIVDEGDTTDDDLPVLRDPSNTTTSISKEILRVSNANKRKRSEPLLGDPDTSDDHHVAIGRKKARTGSITGAISHPQATTSTEESKVDIEEGAKTLLLFAQGAQQSSLTPSPPPRKITNGVGAKANTHSRLIKNYTARSASPFADLPVWPPAAAPTSETASTTQTFPPPRDYYGRAAARQAKEQAATAPTPRKGMLNRTWFPKKPEDRAKANAEYQAGVNADLAVTGDAMDTERPAISLNESRSHEPLDQEPDLTTEQALQLKKAREAVADHAYQQTGCGEKLAGVVQVIEVVETVTKTVETPLRKGIALVKDIEQATPSPKMRRLSWS